MYPNLFSRRKFPSARTQIPPPIMKWNYCPSSPRLHDPSKSSSVFGVGPPNLAASLNTSVGSHFRKYNYGTEWHESREDGRRCCGIPAEMEKKIARDYRENVTLFHFNGGPQSETVSPPRQLLSDARTSAYSHFTDVRHILSSANRLAAKFTGAQFCVRANS